MDWANDNAGSVELTGHLAAVGQRRLAIQNQIQQIAALQSLAEVQQRQQMEKSLLEERQNALYDISAALEDIKPLFDHEPARAYYEFLVLEEFVSYLGLEHRMFSSLEWKNHCNRTLTGISELKAWCKSSLSPEQIKAATDALAQRKRAEKRTEYRRRQQQRRVEGETQATAISKKLRQSEKACFVCFCLAVAFGLFGFFASEASPERMWCIIMAGGFVLCFMKTGFEMLKHEKSLNDLEE